MPNIRQYLGTILSKLAAVVAVPVGQPNDGLTMRGPTDLDKSWSDLKQEFTDSLDAWRNNPLARRLVGLITAYVVGNGITLTSQERELNDFMAHFWALNNLDQRLDEWSDELARTGELYPVLFTNPVSGHSRLRVIPASRIEQINVDGEDYERELTYSEYHTPGVPARIWQGTGNDNIPITTPLMLHYAVNRPIGAVRGESDLAPILPWLRRYNRWLEDRVRLNAAMRAFLWVVHAPARLRATLEERYRTPPQPGSIVIAEQDAETWEAISPNLHAADAEKDGRAIRWMIASGGPGTSLLDFGEGEDSNLATGQAMAEMRRRFLRRRQTYLSWLLIDLALHAWTRYAAVNRITADYDHTSITAAVPDISPEDNQALASSVRDLASSLTELSKLIGSGDTYRRLSLRLFARFAGEQLTDEDTERILSESEQPTAIRMGNQPAPMQTQQNQQNGESPDA